MKLFHPKTIPKPDSSLPLNTGGIVLGMDQQRGKERLYYVGDDVHTLCIGATRSGKSRSVVLQSIGLLALAGESLVISDPKGTPASAFCCRSACSLPRRSRHCASLRPSLSMRLPIKATFLWLILARRNKRFLLFCRTKRRPFIRWPP